MSTPLRVEIVPEAEADLNNVGRWTTENFGPRQADSYVESIFDAIAELAHDSHLPRSKARDEILLGLRTLTYGQARTSRTACDLL
jgi:toxin ParE1/3/4